MDIGTTLITGIAQGGPIAVLAAFALWLWFKQQSKAKGGEVPTRENGTPLSWADPASERAIKELPDLIRAGNETGKSQLKQTQEMNLCLARLADFDAKLLDAAERGLADHGSARESMNQILFHVQNTPK